MFEEHEHSNLSTQPENEYFFGGCLQNSNVCDHLFLLQTSYYYNIESRDNDEDCMNGAVADTAQFKIAEFTSISAKHNLTFVPEMLFQLTG